MKTFYTSILILSLIFFNNLYPQVNTDWQWSHPAPQGNDIRYIKMLTANNWVAVGYTGTLMRTTNAGSNWEVYSNYFGIYPAFLGQGKNIYDAHFKDASTGIACGTQGYIARTINGGVDWDSIGSPAGTIALWEVSFGDANTVYIGGNSGLVLKSTNAGMNWTSSPSPSGNANRSIFALNANTVFTGSTAGNIYRTTNGGSSWTPINTGSSSPIIYGIYFFNTNTGIVSGASGYARYTTNGGTSWNVPAVSVTASETRVFGRTSPDEIYLLGDVNNIYKSTDYGATWTTIPFKFSQQVLGLATNTMDISGNTFVVGGVNGLLNASTNSGVNWFGISNVLNNINMYDIEYNSGSGNVWTVGRGTTGISNAILFSSDRGISWRTQSTPTGADYRAISMADENTGWVVGQSGTVIRTTNGGDNWLEVTNVPTSTQTLTRVHFVNANTGWIFGYSAGPNLFKTTNGGTNWITQTYGSSDNGARWASMVDANTGYYITYNITGSRIFKTTNGGDNWTENFYPNPGNLWGIKMINVNTGYVCGDGGRLFRTTDGGSNWLTVTPPGSNNYTSTDWYDIDNGVIGAGSGYTARTTNGGQSWLIRNTGGSSVWNLEMTHPDTIWCSQYLGYIFRFISGITIGITEWKNEIPENFVLKQNYPNPFNPTTTIEFGLKKAGVVSLKIYDITGKLVDVILNEIQFNAGILKVTYDASKLSSGVYFYSLDVDNKRIDTKKMLMIK